MMEDSLNKLPELELQAAHEVLDCLHCSFYIAVFVLIRAFGRGELLQEELQAFSHELLDHCLVPLDQVVVSDDLEGCDQCVHAFFSFAALSLLYLHSFSQEGQCRKQVTFDGVSIEADDVSDSTDDVRPTGVMLHQFYKLINLLNHHYCIVLTSLAESTISLFCKQIIIKTYRVVVEELLYHDDILSLVAHQRTEQLQECSFDEDWSLELRISVEFYVGIDQHVDILVDEVQIFQWVAQRKEEDFQVSPKGVATLLQFSDLVTGPVHVLLVGQYPRQDAKQFLCFFPSFVDVLSLIVFLYDFAFGLSIEAIHQKLCIPTLTAQGSVDIFDHIFDINPNRDPFLSKIDLPVHFLKVNLPKIAVILENANTLPCEYCYFVDKSYTFSLEISEVVNRSLGEVEHKVNIGFSIVFFMFGQEFFDQLQQTYYIKPQVPYNWGVFLTTLGQLDDPLQTVQGAFRSIVEFIQHVKELRHECVLQQAVEDCWRFIDGHPSSEAVDELAVVDVLVLPETIGYLIQKRQDGSLSLYDLLLHVLTREVIQDQLGIVQFHCDFRQDLEIAIVKMPIIALIERLQEVIDSDGFK